jgi:hypothetical protein
MKRLLMVPLFLLAAVPSWAATGVVILDYMHGQGAGVWASMVEYALLLGAGRALGIT